MAIVKPDLSQQWASDGDKIAPSGAKIQAGWGPEIPPYQWENFIQNRQDEMLAYLNERGIPEWDNRTNYVGGGKSYAQGSDGVVYKSVAASGPATAVQDPTSDVTDVYWTVAFADVGAFLTEGAGDTRYTQRSNNLSDLSDIPTARINLGLDNAFKAGIVGSYSNLKASATGTNATVTVTADAICLKNASNEQVVISGVSIIPSIAVSGANGLDSGVSAASTWYSVWVIWNGTTTAGLLSLSATAPTLPAGYTHKARVGWIRTDATVNKFPLRFFQSNSRCQYGVLTGSNLTAARVAAIGPQGNISTPTWVAVSMTQFVPQTAGIVHLCTIQNGSSAGVVAPNNSYGGYQSLTNQPPMSFTGGTGNAQTNVPFSLVLEGADIYTALSNSNSGVIVLGWEDNL